MQIGFERENEFMNDSNWYSGERDPGNTTECTVKVVVKRTSNL